MYWLERSSCLRQHRDLRVLDVHGTEANRWVAQRLTHTDENEFVPMFDEIAVNY
jgi:hypothetical protein